MAFLWAASDSKERFSLLLLDPGEIYFQDFSAILHPLEYSEEEAIKRSQKGRLKICSKSVVFEPKDFIFPVIKISYSDMEKLESWERDLLSKLGSPDRSFVIETKQIVEMKKQNVIAPYEFVRTHRRLLFTLTHSLTDDCLPYLSQLHRASTLPVADQNAMISAIVMSRHNRQKFDASRLDDLYETIVKEALVDHVTPLVVNPGRLMLTSSRLYFQPFNNATSLLKIRLRDIKQLIKRRFLLRNQALEIYSKEDVKTSWPHLYICFKSDVERDEAYALLLQQEGVKLEDLVQSNMTLRWQNRAISNFEYLSYLNSQADRSINDLTQYPVFPWVLSDYTSSSLDLTKEESYRDLSKPVGALNEERLIKLRARFKEMPEPRFLYGSHYSSPAHVLFYLARAAPEYLLCLHNGRFDAADRMFNSVGQAYRNCLTSLSDFKELIPEFYDSDGEFLLNLHMINFGARQDGRSIGDVELPPWAKSAKDFICKMREALESDYVSRHLHNWIDLIFGYKQQGEEAKKADNVFVHLTYEGAVDLHSIHDENERVALKTQIMEFGQTPKQLFFCSHPQRCSANELLELELTSVTSSHQDVIPADEADSGCSTTFHSYHEHMLHRQTLLDVRWCANGDNIISASHDGSLKLYNIVTQSQLHSCSPSNMPVSSIVLLPDEKTVIVGSWDNNIYVYSLEYGRMVCCIPAHDDAISQMSMDESVLVSSSWDSTVKVWTCSLNGRETVSPKIQAELEHDIGVNCVCQNSSSNRLVSGTHEGQVYIWDREYFQIIEKRQAHLCQVCSVSFSPDGRRLVSCGDDGFLKIYDMKTGTEVFAKNAGCGLKCAAWSGLNIVTGCDNGQMLVWDITRGDIQYSVPAHEGAMTCVSVSENHAVCTGGADRKVKLWRCS